MHHLEDFVKNTGCFKKYPFKLFGIFSLRLSLFYMKFGKFVGNSYSHISTNFCRFILIFHRMASIFRRVPIVFTLSSFEYSAIKWKWQYTSFSEVTYLLSSRVIVPVTVNSWKVSDFFTINVLLTLFYSLVGPTNGKIVLSLQRQTVHADAVAGLSLTHCLGRAAEPVRSTRLQTFLTVLNFHPLSG